MKPLPRKALFFVFLLFASSPLGAEQSLSDLSLESFAPKVASPNLRDPFAPTQIDNSADISALDLEGIITGPEGKLCLVSGKILTEGRKIAAFTVKEIRPTEVVVDSPRGPHTLSLKHYFPPRSGTGELFDIVFEDAGLKEALNSIAFAGRFNLIVPQDLAGSVSLAFQEIPIRDALGSILRVNKMEYAVENGVYRVGSQDQFPAGSNFETREMTLRFATAKDLVDTVKSHLSGKGSVTADPRTNTIIIKDQEAVLQNVTDLLHLLDRPDMQVRIEAMIVDVSRNFSRSLGVQWSLTKTTGDVNLRGASGTSSTTGNPFNVNLPAVSPTSGVGLRVGNIFDNYNLEAQLTAAETKGDAHIISHPTVTTVNNKAAKIRSGLKIYVKTSQSTSTASQSTDIKEIPTGIELRVTPQITAGNTIKMTIDAEESQADFTRTVDNIPAVSDNTASTTVLVSDGETTVIGGMLKINKTRTTNQVPLFGSIPGLGWLFKSSNRSKTDNELLIFITPTIVGQTSQRVAQKQDAPEPAAAKGGVRTAGTADVVRPTDTSESIETEVIDTPRMGIIEGKRMGRRLNKYAR